MRRWVGHAVLAAALLAAAGAAATNAGWFRQIEIVWELEVDGQRDCTIRFQPETSHQCAYIAFECVYHQEFPWEDTRGRKYTKIHEPVSYQYRRKDLKFVNDLDTYVSFRVPVGLKRLQDIYGEKVFNKDYPVTVDRVKIAGVSAEDKTLWSFELAGGGIHDIAELLRKLSAAAAKAKASEEEEGEAGE